MSYYHQQPNVFSVSQLSKLRDKILHCPYFVTNNLNRDFIGTKGFSVVFRRSHIPEVERQFPFFKRYLDVALQPDCNAFYLNPLELRAGSQVYPHIDRSLRSYCKTIEPPDVVTVLYIQVPEGMRGGELVLRDHRRQVGEIKPQANSLLQFQGNLTHSVKVVETVGFRLSLVCEQYNLVETELEEIPEFTVESRAAKVKPKT